MVINLAKNYFIKWQSGEKGDLKKAINTFNNEIKKLEKSMNYLPEKLDYDEEVSKITTRKDYNRLMRELNAFSKDSAKDMITLKSGQNISRWETTLAVWRSKES